MAEEVFEKAKQYALRLIEYRPRSEKELSKRLEDKGYSSEVANSVIDYFKLAGLIDDRSFARLWARRRLQTDGKGPSVIKTELLAKNIDKEIVAETIEGLREDFNEEEIARGLVKKRIELLKRVDKNIARQRLFGYLKRRGFSNEVIYKLLNEAY